jgi:hypothetical protein
MTLQTENYLILKPIAERFNRVSAEISDDDIKYMIKSLMKEKIAEAIDFSVVSDIINECLEEHKDEIAHAAMDSLANRLELPHGYSWY